MGYKKGTYHHSEEVKKKIAEASRGRKHNRGKTRSDEFKQKVSISMKRVVKRGALSPNWTGGKEKNSVRALELKAGRRKPNHCELCGRESKRICFDHDHATGKFRGWICTKCNLALGHVDDSEHILLLMIEYLRKANQ